MHASRTRRRLIFLLALAVAFFGTVELVLRIPLLGRRVPTLDPWAGFAPRTALFEPDGDALVLRPDALNTFNPARIDGTRRPGSVRVVTLGGSSTHGYPYGDARSFSHFLERRLAFLAPDRHVEVVNLGAMSFGSHRVLALTDTVLGLAPDLVVVYSGHNEFIEGAVLERVLEDGRGLLAVRSVLARSRLYGLLAGAAGQLARRRQVTRGSEEDLFGLHITRNEGRLFSLEDKARVARAYGERLRTLVSRYRAAGVPVVVSTMPSNLRDWQPETLAFAYPLEGERRREFMLHLARGRQALDGGDAGAAAGELAAAEAIEDRHAYTAFLHARALDALGRAAEARTAYERARDLDPVPIRALGAMNDEVRRTAAASDAVLLDAEGAFAEASPGGIAGRELVLDYVHPTVEGHALIADRLTRLLLARRLLQGLGPAAEPALDRFVPTDEVAPPEDELPSGVLWWLGAVAKRQGRLAEAERLFERALEADPGNAQALFQLGAVLESKGDLAAARPIFERIARRPGALPRDRVPLVRMLIAAGDLDEARATIAEITTADPNDPGAWFQYSRVERASGDLEAARRHLERATGLLPDQDWQAWEALGDVCAELEDRTCAIRAYRQALSIVRDSPRIAAALAALEGAAEPARPGG